MQIGTFNCKLLNSSNKNQTQIKMKFAVAGLLAVFAVCAQGSAVWPYGASPYSAWPYSGAHAYSSVAAHAPITQYASYPAHGWAHASPISYAAHVSAPQVYAAPLAYHAPAAYSAPHVYAAPHAYAHHVAPVVKVAATYTAANRGSVHTAPLEGHALSQTSLNLAPAPGTL